MARLIAMISERLRPDDPAIHADAILTELAMSHGDLANLLRTALKARHPGPDTHIWPRDVYDDHAVYEFSTDDQTTLLQRSYAIVDGTVTFGDPVTVVAVTQYVPVDEAEREGLIERPSLASERAELIGDLVPLTEKAVSKDGGIKIKIIQAGQGTSGYYSADMLKRDGPTVFKAGTHMHLDHPSISEETDRPERSVTTLAGTLTSDARWEENGAAGPGLYAEAKLRSDLAPLIEELAPSIGVSIRALGKASEGSVDGKKVRVIDAIEQAKSVDFVTVPGAGGKVLDLIEAARQGITPAGVPAPGITEVDEVDKAAFEQARTDLAEARKQITELEQWKTAQERRAAEAVLVREAHGIVTETLAGIQLPTPTRERLTGQLAATPPTKDGTLDREALVAKVKEAAAAEIAYLASVTGGDRVRGMGGTTPQESDPSKLTERLERGFAALGLSEAVAKQAAAGWNA